MAQEILTSDELILRDQLVLDHTGLANERTVLAYARTALMLVIAGATAVKFIFIGELRSASSPAGLSWCSES